MNLESLFSEQNMGKRKAEILTADDEAHILGLLN